MIEAFEAGSALSACGRESPDAAAEARRRAAWDGVAIAADTGWAPGAPPGEEEVAPASMEVRERSRAAPDYASDPLAAVRVAMGGGGGLGTAMALPAGFMGAGEAIADVFAKPGAGDAVAGFDRADVPSGRNPGWNDGVSGGEPPGPGMVTVAAGGPAAETGSAVSVAHGAPAEALLVSRAVPSVTDAGVPDAARPVVPRDLALAPAGMSALGAREVAGWSDGAVAAALDDGSVAPSLLLRGGTAIVPAPGGGASEVAPPVGPPPMTAAWPSLAAGRFVAPPAAPPDDAPFAASRDGGAAPGGAADDAVANDAGGQDGGPPIVVHAAFHLDGRVLAEAVCTHLVGEMNGPLGGTGGFDGRRSYTPVEG